MRALAAAREQWLESFIMDVEPAGIGAEGRHHSAAAVGDQTPSALAGNARDWMQMPGDLAELRTRPRLMAQMQRANFERRQALAAGVNGNVWIVIAGNPDPIASGLQRRERRMIGTSHALRPAIVMKTVAERDDAAWRPA